jgi:hypothetical protein
MFGNGHQFDMGEAQVAEVVAELMCELPVVQEGAVLAAPRTQMHLIQGHGGGETVAFSSRLHPA